MTMQTVTHWMPLPSPPINAESSTLNSIAPNSIGATSKFSAVVEWPNRIISMTDCDSASGKSGGE